MKRFYKQVTKAPVEGGWQVQLDGRGMKTQVGSPQVVPSEKLAQLLAKEWDDQGEEIDPKSFIFRDMADYAIDVIAKDRDELIRGLLLYSQTDTLCHRADPEDALYQRQLELWEPLVTACEAKHDIRLSRVSGIQHKPQDPETTAKLTRLLEGMDHFELAGLQTLTALSASLVTGLAAMEEDAEAESLFAAANAEEDWQAELWGWDGEAEQRRAMRLQAFTRAMHFLAAARS